MLNNLPEKSKEKAKRKIFHHTAMKQGGCPDSFIRTQSRLYHLDGIQFEQHIGGISVYNNALSVSRTLMLNIHCSVEEGQLIIKIFDQTVVKSYFEELNGKKFVQFDSEAFKGEVVLAIEMAALYFSYYHEQNVEVLLDILWVMAMNALYPKNQLLITDRYKFMNSLALLTINNSKNILSAYKVNRIKQFKNLKGVTDFKLFGTYHDEHVSTHHKEEITFENFQPSQEVIESLSYLLRGQHANYFDLSYVVPEPAETYGSILDLGNWMEEYAAHDHCDHYLSNLFFGSNELTCERAYALPLNLPDRFEVSFYHVKNGKLIKYTYTTPRSSLKEAQLPECFMKAVEKYCELNHIPKKTMATVFSLLMHCAAYTQRANYDKSDPDIYDECRGAWFLKEIRHYLKLTA